MRESLAALSNGDVPRSIFGDAVDAYVDSLAGSRAIVEAARFFPKLAATRRAASWSRLSLRVFKECPDAARALLALFPLPLGPPREWTPPGSTVAALITAVDSASTDAVLGDPPLIIRRSCVGLEPAAYDAAIAFFVSSDDVENANALRAAIRCWWLPKDSPLAPQALTGEIFKLAHDATQSRANPAAIFQRVVSLARNVFDDIVKVPEASRGEFNDEENEDAHVAGDDLESSAFVESTPSLAASRAPLFNVDYARDLLVARLDVLGLLPTPPSVLPPLVDALADVHLLAGDVRAAVETYLSLGAALAKCEARNPFGTEVSQGPAGSPALFAILNSYNAWELVSLRVRDLVTLCRKHSLDAFALRLPGPGAEQKSRGGGLFPLTAVLSQLDEGGSAANADVCDYLLALSMLRHTAFDVADAAGGELSRAHARLLNLLPVHRPDALIDYLKRSAAYPFEAARDLCLRGGAPLGAPPREPPLWRELAFVLERSGNAREALDVMLGKLGDVRAAIALTMRADSGDGYLYGDLLAATVRASIAAPTPEEGGELFGRLLDELNETPFQLERVLKALPSTLPIPRLKERLRSVLSVATSKVQRLSVVKSMNSHDMGHLVTQLFRKREKAVRVDDPVGLACALCAGSAAAPRSAATVEAKSSDNLDAGDMGTPLVHIFFCGHMCHSSCLAVFAAGSSLAAAASGRSSRSSSFSMTNKGVAPRMGAGLPRSPAASRVVSAPKFTPVQGARKSSRSFSEQRVGRSSVIDADFAHLANDPFLDAVNAAARASSRTFTVYGKVSENVFTARDFNGSRCAIEAAWIAAQKRGEDAWGVATAAALEKLNAKVEPSQSGAVWPDFDVALVDAVSKAATERTRKLKCPRCERDASNATR
jgi:hypothetical protein